MQHLLLIAALLAVALFLHQRWYRLGDVPAPAAFLPPAAAAAAFIGLLLAGQLGAECVRVLILGGMGREALSRAALSDHARLMAGQYAAQALVVAAIVAVAGAMRDAGHQAPGPARPGWRRALLVGTGGLAIFWPVVAACSLLLGELVERLRGEPVEPVAHRTLKRLVEGPGDGWLILTAVLVVVAAPLFEEIAYRGFLQRMLGQVGLGRWAAIAASSALFAAVHVDVAAPQAVGALFVLSLGLGWAYEKSGHLAAPILMHALFNAGNIAVTWALLRGPLSPGPLSG